MSNFTHMVAINLLGVTDRSGAGTIFSGKYAADGSPIITKRPRYIQPGETFPITDLDDGITGARELAAMGAARWADDGEIARFEEDR